MKVPKYDESVLIRQQTIRREDQMEASLFGYVYSASRSRDRRGEAVEMTDPATGLPATANALLPKHRATEGMELVLSDIISPKLFCAAAVFTDELEENLGLPPEKREWRSLQFVEKKNWSDEAIKVIDRNVQTLHLVLTRWRGHGWVELSPQIDDSPRGGLGTDRLALDKAGRSMGFSFLYPVVPAAEEFIRLHPRFAQQYQPLYVAMGRGLSSKAPEWWQKEQGPKAKNPLEINS